VVMVTVMVMIMVMAMVMDEIKSSRKAKHIFYQEEMRKLISSSMSSLYLWRERCCVMLSLVLTMLSLSYVMLSQCYVMLSTCGGIL
jgi:hypothetical protein